MTREHETLNVSPDADLDEIKSAYKRLAMRFHPDREGGDLEKFQQVTKAYKKLTEKCQEPGCVSGIIHERRGAFIKKRDCPRCWSHIK